MAIQTPLTVLVDEAIKNVLEILQQFSSDDILFRNTIDIAFGEEVDVSRLQVIFANENLLNLPSK